MPELHIFKADLKNSFQLPYFNEMRAGFPSPSLNYGDKLLDLNKELIQHPAATFLAKVVGLSLIKAGIEEGDILVIDRSITPKHGSIVIAYIEGEFTAKRLDLTKIKEGKVILRSENDDYPDFIISTDDRFTVWGVVSSVVKRLAPH